VSVSYGFEYKRAKKRAEELKGFLIELDSICDKLYNRLDYSGVWESLMKLEDVRVRYYIEFYEHDKIVRLRGKNGR
jgi:hypothetical protein